MAKKMGDEAKTNGFDRDKLAAVVKAVEAEHAKLLSLQGSYMNECRPHHELIRQIIKDARTNDHIPSKELRAVLADREYQKKREKLRADLDMEEQANYSQMLELLGDFGGTSLGKAALRTAPGAPKEEEDLRPRFTKEQEAERQAAENKARLEGGLTPIQH